MWGKNDGHSEYHYYTSTAQSRYACGERQKATRIVSAGLPTKPCRICADRFQRLPEAVKQAELQGAPLGYQKRSAEARPSPAPPPQIAGRPLSIAPESLTREFEEQWLQGVLEQIGQDLGEVRDAIRKSAVSIRHAAGNDFTAGVIAAWKYHTPRQRLEALEPLAGSPYFARVDFAESDADSIERIYIGKLTIYRAGEILVHDWRAPISRLYYIGQAGQADYEAPAGLIVGHVFLIRSFEIGGAKLIAFRDISASTDGAVVGHRDELLLSLLETSSAGPIHEIVRSIQAEQDAIIRTRVRAMQVLGPAGSGKTVVALHRAAYLLYDERIQALRGGREPSSVTAQQMVLISPNRLFSAYVRYVLPDLGESNIRSLVLDDWATRWIVNQRGLKEYASETQDDYLERVAAKGPFNDFNWSELKRLLEDKLREVESTVAAAFTDVSSPLRVGVSLIEKSRLLQQINAREPHTSLRAQLDRITDWIRQQQSRFTSQPYVGREQIQTVEKSIGNLLKSIENAKKSIPSPVKILEETLREFQTRLPSLPVQGFRLCEERIFRDGSRTNANAEYDTLDEAIRGRNERLAKLEPKGWVFSSKNFGSAVNAKVSLGTYGAYKVQIWIEKADSAHVNAERPPHHPETHLSHRIPYEFLYPLAHVAGRLEGFPLLGRMTHVFIDEVQGYSPSQLEFLKTCLPSDVGITLVGDLNQRLTGVAQRLNNGTSLSDMPWKVESKSLTRSYRASEEITRFTNYLLRDGTPVRSVRRSGSKPRLYNTDLAPSGHAAIASLAQDLMRAHKTVAIICKTRTSAVELVSLLQSHIQVNLLEPGSTEFASGLYGLSVSTSRGLEFDAVIVTDVDAETYRTDLDRQWLYVACTRALHELFVTYSGQPSPLLPFEEPDLYD